MIISPIIYWLLWAALGIWMGIGIIDGIQLRNQGKKYKEAERQIKDLCNMIDKKDREIKCEIAEKERYQRMANFYADLLSYKNKYDIQ